MSQFRIKNIDGGEIDGWEFRTDDQGAILGDNVTAQDPNELAQAVSDTQELLLKASVYAPSALINLDSGALERIKIIEDTVGSTTLQDAYNEGRFIAIAGGRPLSLGATGEFELDSSGNLTLNTNTFKVTNGISDMLITETGIRSTNANLTFGSSSTSKDTTVTSGRAIILKDVYLSSSIGLSENGQTELVTVSNSLVGAINEISGGFTGTDLQQIYDQSAPATIETSFEGGPIRIVNGSGSSSVPALIIDGGINCVDFLDVDKLTVGPGATINLTLENDGRINTTGDIETTGKLIGSRIESVLDSLTIADSRGSLELTTIQDPILLTTKQTLFGSLNEINQIALSNAESLAILDSEHDLSLGLHTIINTQSETGDESISRFNIKDGIGATVLSMNALGEITAKGLELNSYNVLDELDAGVAHRADGVGHADVASHFLAENPHNTVGSLSILGDLELNGDVTLEQGAGVTLSRSGQNIRISASSGTTLQGVYENQLDGELKLDTTANKDFIIKNTADEMIARFKAEEVQVNKDLSITAPAGKIGGIATLELSAVSTLDIKSSSDNVNIDAISGGRTTVIQGVPFTDGFPSSIHEGLSGEVVSSINDLADNDFTTGTNATGDTQLKGTAVILRENGTFWLPYPDVAEACAVLETPLSADLYWHGSGVLAEDIVAGASGLVKTSGVITANVGKMDVFTDWRRNDTLYVSRSGYSEVTVGALSDGNEVRLDDSNANKAYIARGSGATPSLGEFDIAGSSNADIDATRNNMIATLNNEVYMATGSSLYIQAFLAGDAAKGRVNGSGVGSIGDTITLSPSASIPGSAITLTAIANGSTPTSLEYELGLTTEETIFHLMEAINRTTLSDGSAGNGHGCIGNQYGAYIEIEWRGPGRSGNEISLTVSSSALTCSPSLTGGTAKIQIFTSNRSATGKTCTASGGLLVTDFSSDEGASQYINQIKWFSPDREIKADDRRIKIGKVINYSDPLLTFMVNIEEPRKNNIRRGRPYDTEY